MSTIPQPSSGRIVAITSIDVVNRKAMGMSRNQTNLSIDLSYHVGGVLITPAVGEQWVVIRADMASYRLDRKLQMGEQALLTAAQPGQMHIGSSGPTELQGSQLNANAPMRLLGGGTNPPALPAAADTDEGSVAYNTTTNRPTFSNGATWNDLSTTADVTSAVASANTIRRTAVITTPVNVSAATNTTLFSSALPTLAVGSVFRIHMLGSFTIPSYSAYTITYTAYLGSTALNQTIAWTPQGSSLTMELFLAVTALGTSGTVFTQWDGDNLATASVVSTAPTLAGANTTTVNTTTATTVSVKALWSTALAGNFATSNIVTIEQIA